MADIVVKLPNGTEATFPEGTPPETIQAIVQAATPKSGDPAPSGDPKKLHQETTNTSSKAKPGGLADSFLGRMVRGTLVNRIDPLAETVARTAEGLAPELLKGETARVQAMNRERRALHEASRERAGDSGFDIPATVGTAATDIAATRGLMQRVGRPDLASPNNIPDLAKQGAVAGGVGALMSPVEGSDSGEMGGADYALKKAMQIGVGTPVGAVAAPLGAVVINKALQATGSVGSEIGRIARNFLKPPAAVSFTNDPAQLERFLAGQAAEVGLNWARVPEQLRTSMRQAAIRATRSTGELPVAAIRNRMVAEAEGLPQLTLGQATRDPAQFSRELNSADEGLRNYLGSQQRAADTRLNEIVAAAGPTRSPYEAGNVVADAVGRQAASRRTGVNNLYDAARDSRGGYQTLQNTSEFVGNAVTALKQKQLWEELPQGLRNQLQALYASNGQLKLTVRQAIQMRQNLNALGTDQRTPANAALGVVKTELDKFLANPQLRSEVGEEALAAFKTANSARAAVGRWEGSSRAVADLASRAPKIAPENIFSRYVMNGTVKDFEGLWGTLPTEARTAMKRQFVATVVNAAFNKYNSSASSPAAAVDLLNRFPKEKLNMMFTFKELSSLRNTLEYLRMLKDEPAGGFVNRSRTSIDLKDLIANSTGLPGVGPIVSKPLQQLSEQAGARRALSRDLVAPDESEPMAGLAEALAGRLPLGIPALSAGAIGASRPQDEE